MVIAGLPRPGGPQLGRTMCGPAIEHGKKQACFREG
jgi:hypothetical protein